MNPYLAISVNGGGALGIGPLALMCRIEQDTGKKIGDLAVAFAGTSTGSIIAAGLNEGLSAHDLYDLYYRNLGKIFTKYSWYKRLDTKCPSYDNTYLKKLLQDTFKGKISDWKKPIFIPTTHTNGKSVEKVWDLGDTDVDKWFAVLTSTAAPTYFDVIVKDGQSYADGGLWANSPIAVLNAGLKRSAYAGQLRILSFNTGMDTPNTLVGNQSLIGWASYIFKEWVARAGKSNDYEVIADLGQENVVVASPCYHEKIDMDKTDKATLDKITVLWTDYYDRNRDVFRNFVQL
jgi:patatin-like phospholipase/acyl hydrolase